MQDRKDRLSTSVSEWYRENPKHLKTVMNIIQRERSDISLRILEHFVTNYTERHAVILPNPKKPGEIMDVYWAYKEALKCFHKTLLDPFCRSTAENPRPYQTKSDVKKPSLRQLNFFKWAITTGVLDYVAAHLEEINEDMVASKNGGSGGGSKPCVDRVPSFAGII